LTRTEKRADECASIEVHVRLGVCRATARQVMGCAAAALDERGPDAQARAVLLPACSSGGAMSDHLNIAGAMWRNFSSFQVQCQQNRPRKNFLRKASFRGWQENSIRKFGF
jgi:hypothetical protein